MWKGETVFFLLYVLSHVREGIHKESLSLGGTTVRQIHAQCCCTV